MLRALERGSSFFVFVDWIIGSGGVIGLVRMHCYLNGRFWLVEVPTYEARAKRRELAQQGWIVTHTEAL